MMTTILRRRAAIPQDDWDMLIKVSVALREVEQALPQMQLGVCNGIGEVYREITVHGPSQYRAAKDCFNRLGYRLKPVDDSHLIARFERL